ncbi:ABC transporter permease [Candidatus Woesearchaeota archaeon]|nr:ABC transporter permease [Candidatus Woesearchaeota archaeon]
MLLDYFNLAFKGIKRRKLRSWLTMLGIFIGISAIVALIGLGEGLRESINSQFGFLGTDLFAITASGGMGPPGSGVVNPLTDKELNRIKGVLGVEKAAGRIQESVKLIFNKKSSFTYAISIPDGEDREVIEHALSMKVQEGRLLEDGDKDFVFLGARYSEDDNKFGKAIVKGSKIEIRGKEFKVIGIMEKKGNLMMDSAIFMNDEDIRGLVDRPKNEYDLIGVIFDENKGVVKIKEDIEDRLRKVRDVKKGEEDFSVETPASMLEQVNSIILGIQIFVYIIAGISILVGGIGIMNTMYTAVVERTKEVGIMKSIGARNSTIFTLFFIESGFLGTVGGIMGIIIGYSMATGLAFMGRMVLGVKTLYPHFPLSLFIGAFLFSFILGSFFGTLPAIQASKLNPVDALRNIK